MGVILYTTAQIKVLGVTQLLKFFTHRQFANEDRRPQNTCFRMSIMWNQLVDTFIAHRYFLPHNTYESITHSHASNNVNKYRITRGQSINYSLDSNKKKPTKHLIFSAQILQKPLAFLNNPRIQAQLQHSSDIKLLKVIQDANLPSIYEKQGKRLNKPCQQRINGSPSSGTWIC